MTIMTKQEAVEAILLIKDLTSDLPKLKKLPKKDQAEVVKILKEIRHDLIEFRRNNPDA